MLAALRHRGPDGEGMWREGGVWLGHRRLAVIDISPAGAQPMHSRDGRWVLTANGEIYNFADLRAELDRVAPGPWRGHCDMEVLIEAIAAFGVEAALARAHGQFAFAAYDRQTRTVHLARDRFGEKPLYYADQGHALTYASELTALERAPGVAGDPDPAALSLYFRLGYVPAPLAICAGVRKLPPGCVLSWRAGEGATPRPYWSLADLVAAGARAPITDPQAAVEGLDAVLRAAVRRQMVADVPLGAFLSGGVDSSLVTAVMQQVADRPVRTFTLGFEIAEYDEAPYARAVAAHLRTDHVEHVFTDADARAVAPTLGALYDEPFADSSGIPTALLSRLAREQVTVCLTGDGGDELFAGYVRYPGVPRLWRVLRRLPLRGAASAALGAVPPRLLAGMLSFLGPVARQYASRGDLAASLRRLAPWLAATSQEDLYELAMTAWPAPERLLAHPPAEIPPWRPPAPTFNSFLDAMQWRDGVDYLPGDILAKVDRAAMAFSLETRAPLLDPAVAAYAWRLAPEVRTAGGRLKWPLRALLERYLPVELIERPKLGFTPPLHAWLTGPLRPWAEDLISESRLVRQGLLRPEPAARLWRDYVRGDSSGSHKVWCLLMLQSWLAARGR